LVAAKRHSVNQRNPRTGVFAFAGSRRSTSEVVLRRQLKPILPDFDIVLIDTPPAMRAATVNALVVADSVIIPIDSSSFALLGMNQLLKTIAAISETHNPSLRILVLTTMFNKRMIHRHSSDRSANAILSLAARRYHAPIRENRRPFANIRMAASAAVTTIMGSTAVYERRMVTWNELGISV
jgi:chromosome partitioning protein